MPQDTIRLLLSPKTRLRAARLLGYDGLRDLAHHASIPAVREAAVRALQFFPERVTDTVALLGESAPEVWRTAAQTLIAMGVEPHALFAHPNPLIALRAAYMLALLDPQTPWGAESLIKALNALESSNNLEMLSVALDAVGTLAERGLPSAVVMGVVRVLKAHAFHLPRSGLVLVRRLVALNGPDSVKALAEIAQLPAEVGSVALAGLQEMARMGGRVGEMAKQALAEQKRMGQ